MAATEPEPAAPGERDAGASLRCSDWTRENSVDPVGSAGSYAGFLLVEWPLPWPRDISEVAELDGLAGELRRARVRLQGLVPRGDGPTRVVHYRGDPRRRGGYEGLEVELDAPAAGGAAVVEAAVALIRGEAITGAHAPAAPDVLVCGHGSRDRCCGSLGTALERSLSGAGFEDRHRVRLWRTSHTGGHRFAPTAILLPEGTVWGYLDAGVLGDLCDRRGPVEAVVPHYRGCAALPSPEVQALERSVLAEVGWALLDMPRWGRTGEDGMTQLVAEQPDGTKVTWSARVTVSRMLPVPACGAPIEQAGKAEAELAVGPVDTAA